MVCFHINTTRYYHGFFSPKSLLFTISSLLEPQPLQSTLQGLPLSYRSIMNIYLHMDKEQWKISDPSSGLTSARDLRSVVMPTTLDYLQINLLYSGGMVVYVIYVHVEEHILN